MEIKKLVLRTDTREEKFEIDKIGKRYFVFAVHRNAKGAKQTKKIGETTRWEDALQLATIFSGMPGAEIKIS